MYLLLDVGQRLPFITRKIFTNLEEKFLDMSLRSEWKKRVHSPRADGIESDFNMGRVNSGDVANAVVIFQRLIHLWK